MAAEPAGPDEPAGPAGGRRWLLAALVSCVTAGNASACSSVEANDALGNLDAGEGGFGGSDSTGDDGGDAGSGSDDMPPEPGTDDGGTDGEADEIPVECSEDAATSHFVQSENRVGTRWVAAAVRSILDLDDVAPAGGPPTTQAVLDLYTFPHEVTDGAGLEVSTLVWRSPFATEDRWVFQLAVSSAEDYARGPLDLVVSVAIAAGEEEQVVSRTSAVLADTLDLLAPGDRVTVLSGTTVKLLAHEVTGPGDEVVAAALATATAEEGPDEAAAIDAAYAIVSAQDFPAYPARERRVLFVGRELPQTTPALREVVAAAADTGPGDTPPARFLGVAVGDVEDSAVGLDELALAGRGRALYVTESQMSVRRKAALRAGLFASATDITLDVELPPGLALAAPQWAELNLPIAPPEVAGGPDQPTPLPGPSLLTLGVGETLVLQRTLVGCGNRIDGPTPVIVHTEWTDGTSGSSTTDDFEFDLSEVGAGTVANASEGLRLHKARVVVAFAEVLTAWVSGGANLAEPAERTLALLDSIQPSMREDLELAEIRAVVEALLVTGEQQSP